jgi:hypothetical protein
MPEERNVTSIHHIYPFLFAGGPGAGLHDHLHNRDVHQDPGPRIHPAQEQLHEEPVEHHGLYRRCLWVSGKSRAACPTSKAHCNYRAGLHCFKFLGKGRSECNPDSSVIITWSCCCCCNNVYVLLWSCCCGGWLSRLGAGYTCAISCAICCISQMRFHVRTVIALRT